MKQHFNPTHSPGFIWVFETANDCGNLEMFHCISKLAQGMRFFIITRNSLWDCHKSCWDHKKRKQDKIKQNPLHKHIKTV